MFTVIIGLIWEQRKVIAEVAVIGAIAYLAWWGFVSNPEKLRKQQQEIVQLKEQVKDCQDAVTLLTNISTRKGSIDASVQAQITSLHRKVFPRHSSGVFRPAGRL